MGGRKDPTSFGSPENSQVNVWIDTRRSWEQGGCCLGPHTNARLAWGSPQTPMIDRVLLYHIAVSGIPMEGLPPPPPGWAHRQWAAGGGGNHRDVGKGDQGGSEGRWSGTTIA